LTEAAADAYPISSARHEFAATFQKWTSQALERQVVAKHVVEANLCMDCYPERKMETSKVMAGSGTRSMYASRAMKTCKAKVTT